MPIPVSIPRLGWNMEEGVFVGWLKADGDAVKSGDAVFTLEGEKATEDVESLDAGTLHIPADGPQAGDKLAVGAVIGYLLAAGEAPPTPGRAGGVSPPSAEAIAPVAAQTQVTDAPPAPPAEDVPAVTPRARRLAARLGVDAAAVRGSGRNGRVRERDIPDSPPRSRKRLQSPPPAGRSPRAWWRAARRPPRSRSRRRSMRPTSSTCASSSRRSRTASRCRRIRTSS